MHPIFYCTLHIWSLPFLIPPKPSPHCNISVVKRPWSGCMIVCIYMPTCFSHITIVFRSVGFGMMFQGDFPCFGFRFVYVFCFVCFVAVVVVLFLCVIYVLLLYWCVSLLCCVCGGGARQLRYRLDTKCPRNLHYKSTEQGA